jgi:hypothetical protein
MERNQVNDSSLKSSTGKLQEPQNDNQTRLESQHTVAEVVWKPSDAESYSCFMREKGMKCENRQLPYASPILNRQPKVRGEFFYIQSFQSLKQFERLV